MTPTATALFESITNTGGLYDRCRRAADYPREQAVPAFAEIARIGARNYRKEFPNEPQPDTADVLEAASALYRYYRRHNFDRAFLTRAAS